MVISAASRDHWYITLSYHITYHWYITHTMIDLVNVRSSQLVPFINELR